ncbi:DUF262 domain-containing protein [Pectobacterium parvum]|nr:DUF262 domain-containing protein [Pectobacterium parvum]UFK38050.1 DUF262 domain-containing protein [Pectobacterium parvum]
MKATETHLLKFLRKSPQFVIPIYQRNYSWTEAQCQQLWSDLLRAGRDETINPQLIFIVDGFIRVISIFSCQLIDKIFLNFPELPEMPE